MMVPAFLMKDQPRSHMERENIADGRPVVSGKLHHEGSGIAREHLGLLEHDAGDNDGSHADEVGGGGDPCGAAEDRAGEPWK